MKSAELAALKAHCHIDHNGDDAQLTALYDAAVEYMEGAGVPTPSQKCERYTLCVFALVNDWYDGTASLGSCTVGLRQLINQLKMTAVSDGGVW